MERQSAECANCHSRDFEVTYRPGAFGRCWELELTCKECGRGTLIAVTEKFMPEIDIVNERRKWTDSREKF